MIRALVLSILCAAPLPAQQMRIAVAWQTSRATEYTDFSRIDGVAEAADGTIWATDARAGMLVRLSPEGEPVSIIASRGDMLGQLQLPTLVERSPVDEMIVYDAARAAFEVFRETGAFKGRIQLRSRVVNPKGMAPLTTGDIVLTGGMAGRETSIHQFTRGGSLRRSWYPAERPERSASASSAVSALIAGGPVDPLPDGGLLYSRAAPHLLALFGRRDTTGTRLASDTLIVPPAVDDFTRGDPDDPAGFRWDFTRSVFVGTRTDGTIVNAARREDGLTLFEIYDTEGELLARREVDPAMYVWNFTANGDLLVSWEDDAGAPVLARLSFGYD